jgi:hypothetical protein
VIEGNFHSFVGVKAVRSSGNHSDFVVEAFDRPIGKLTFARNQLGVKRLMSAQHLGHLFHGSEAAAHSAAPPTCAGLYCAVEAGCADALGKSPSLAALRLAAWRRATSFGLAFLGQLFHHLVLSLDLA